MTGPIEAAPSEQLLRPPLREAEAGRPQDVHDSRRQHRELLQSCYTTRDTVQRAAQAMCTTGCGCAPLLRIDMTFPLSFEQCRA